MTFSPDFEVIPAGDIDPAVLVELLSAGYGRPFTEEWFQWKHREGPWGRSRPYVARDDGGVLGVVFGLPWRVQIAGHLVATSRLVDGATTPRSARRGVFRSVVEAELNFWQPHATPGIVVATATPEARAAHVKNGAVALEPIRSAYRPVAWTRARLESGDDVLDSFALPARHGRVVTAWDVPALRWRLDSRSGTEYQVSRLANSDTAHGLVHRTVSQRSVRTVVVTAHWGPAPEVRRVLGSVAASSRAPVVLAPSGPGAIDPDPRVAYRRGQSLLCVWDRRPEPVGISVTDRSSWALDGLSLEGVV